MPVGKCPNPNILMTLAEKSLHKKMFGVIGLFMHLGLFLISFIKRNVQLEICTLL